MNTIERKYEYTLKQYRRDGFGLSYYFVDLYLNTCLENSIIINQELSNIELERLLTVFISQLNKGDDVKFLDSTEIAMNQLILENKNNLSVLERKLASKMGMAQFETNYETDCYYLAFVPGNAVDEVYEPFQVSKTYTPLVCLKSAYQLGKKQGTVFRILLSDKKTEVDSELLTFALSEN